ncbi:MAG: hypothetical protein KC621_28250 [Myxococcales bacterium]|nr:hypothetical protein [Myxococcales bacterium]
MSDPGELLLHHPRFTWREGMRDRAGVRVFDLDLFDATTAPDLEDWATAGILLGALGETGRLTDVVKQGDEWIVAVDLPEDGVQGWAADSLGEAAAYALLGLWDALEVGASQDVDG